MKILHVLSLFFHLFCSGNGQVYLRADGKTDTYSLINSVLGGTAVEVPDCAHPTYGPHITQVTDETLARPVFVFHAHPQDNDRCENFDRQRTEIKTYNSSPAYLKGYNGESITLSWDFRLDSDFQPSSSFTHLHQLKAVDGDDGLPIITLTPRYRSSGNEFELIHIDSKGTTTKPRIISLNSVAGKWIHVREQMTYGYNGKYSIVLTNLSSGEVIMSYSSKTIDLWRNVTSFVRPKWGIYRSLNNQGQLKNEQVKFDSFCPAKGSDNCT